MRSDVVNLEMHFGASRLFFSPGALLQVSQRPLRPSLGKALPVPLNSLPKFRETRYGEPPGGSQTSREDPLTEGGEEGNELISIPLGFAARFLSGGGREGISPGCA